MYVLVINAGSSSLKYQIIDSETEELVTRGLCEKVGYSDAFVQHWNKNDKRVFEEPMEDHLVAVKMVLDVLVQDPDSGIESLDQIGAVGHRIVHGGEKFSESVLADDQVIADIELCSELAPLHNPPAVQCIRACREIMPDVPHVCVFDTAFHQTMPPRAYMYAIPYEFSSSLASGSTVRMALRTAISCNVPRSSWARAPATSSSSPAIWAAAVR